MTHKIRLIRNSIGLLGIILVGAGVAGSLSGCSVSPAAVNPCASLKQGVLPASATADHTAAAPGNQIAFDVGYVSVPVGCAIPALAINPQAFTWVSSDTINAPISNAKDATAGVATCVGATTVPVTISVVSTDSIATATLTCK
jgi:hypothetical protein